MLSLMEPETRSERAVGISGRHRILIVAAVSAIAGGRCRVLEINPVRKRSRNSRGTLLPFMQEVDRAGSRSVMRTKAQGAAV